MLPGEGAAPRVLWSEALSPAERRALLAMSPSRAWLSIGINWGLVAGAFALVAWAPNPLSVVVALFVIGGRQLGFAVLMHEAAHHTLFRSTRTALITCSTMRRPAPRRTRI